MLSWELTKVMSKQYFFILPPPMPPEHTQAKAEMFTGW